MTKIQPVILCGGSGTRLWPLSRMGLPKQFLCLTGKYSLFQQTAMRLTSLSEVSKNFLDPIIICNDEHRFVVTEQMRDVGIDLSVVLLEPSGRNTAPALTLAAMQASEHGGDSILVVLPSDHNISDPESFILSLHQAIECSEAGGLVVMGIRPDRPETGYGYIKVMPSQTDVSKVDRFIEKPTGEMAQRYLEEGGYYWNAGVFVLKASVWLRVLQEFRPYMARIIQNSWKDKTSDGIFIRPDKDTFVSVQAESIDFAVMENCPGSEFEINMVRLDAGWSDLGAWEAIWGVLPKDEKGNAHVGDVIIDDADNSLIHASSRLVALIGVSGLVVIETSDAVLVADKAHSQNVKNIIEKLKKSGREEHVLHRKVIRPWGWFDCIDEGERFKVKRIMVNPGAALSLQKHQHRAEHWIVVKGTAEVTNGDNVFLLTENQSTYIPLGVLHRLANPGTIPLEIIEVQSGSYLGEDDIFRFADTYGRTITK